MLRQVASGCVRCVGWVGGCVLIRDLRSSVRCVRRTERTERRVIFLLMKPFYIINLLSFISIIIYTISPSITNSLGTVVAQPLLHLTVPHGSRSSIDEPIDSSSFSHNYRDIADNLLQSSRHPILYYLL